MTTITYLLIIFYLMTIVLSSFLSEKLLSIDIDNHIGKFARSFRVVEKGMDSYNDYLNGKEPSGIVADLTLHLGSSTGCYFIGQKISSSTYGQLFIEQACNNMYDKHVQPIIKEIQNEHNRQLSNTPYFSTL